MPTIAIGIDVSKKHLDLARSDRTKTTRVPNDAEGHAKVIAFVRQVPDALIVLEPTSRYHRALVHVLTEAGRQPAVVNPFLVHRFGQAKGSRIKSDPIDARLLAAYGLQMQPTPRPLPTENEEQLAIWVARREDLVKARTAEYCRRHLANDALELESITETIAFLAGQIRRIEQAIRTLIASDPALTQRHDLLRTAPGVGFVTAIVLLANLPELGRLTRKTAAALAGLAPYTKQSGSSDRKRCIGGGRSLVRTKLYLMTVTARRDDAIIQAMADRLAPKPYKVVAVALARQLLSVLNAMLRDRIPWDQTDMAKGTFFPDLALAA